MFYRCSCYAIKHIHSCSSSTDTQGAPTPGKASGKKYVHVDTPRPPIAGKSKPATVPSGGFAKPKTPAAKGAAPAQPSANKQNGVKRPNESAANKTPMGKKVKVEVKQESESEEVRSSSVCVF